MTTVAYDSRALLIDGQRTLLLSGAIHYPRSTPEMWPELMQRTRAAGLNAVETYVFWCLHERRRGVLDFSGRLDLRRFCAVAQEHGLHVVLRIGPYVCAEINYGGFPPWLRELGGIQLRTWSEPFLREKERWLRLLCEYLRPAFAPAGGPIILAQVENEYNNIAAHYGEPGRRYLQWAVDLGTSLNLGVPWVMCSGGAPGALETINELYGHRQIEEHARRHPDMPALWTEAYPAWYDTWGYEHHLRSPQDLAYAVARFVAAGGTGVNYYMWHGGTNFGRESMYLQTASYDFDAPLDEYGLETTKSRHLALLHQRLHDHADLLLHQSAARPQSVGPAQALFEYRAPRRRLAFLCNDDPAAAAAVAYEGREYRLAPRAVLLVADGQPCLDTAASEPALRLTRRMEPLAATRLAWRWRPEPQPAHWPRALRRTTVSVLPVEQLQLTADETDYCWYSTELALDDATAGPGTLTVDGGGDFLQLFVDGRHAGATPVPLLENRTLAANRDFQHTFSIDLPPGRHRIDILCAALGLIKGDWMLGFENMVNERKGIWGQVRWNGRDLTQPWRLLPGLAGERLRWFGEGGLLTRWQAPAAAGGRGLAWWRATLARPAGAGPFALDLSGMGKGLVWVNGTCLGRYWLLPSARRNPTTPGDPILTTGRHEPTQRYYHVPADWLGAENTIVLFEELGGDPAGVRLCRRW